MQNIEAQLESRQLRRMRAEPKQLARLDRQMDAAEELIGELQGEAGRRFYINIRSRDGRLTGKIKESRSRAELISYAIRNRYV